MLLRSYNEAAMAAKRICQGGLLLVQHCAPAGQEEECNRELQPETGHRMDRQCYKMPGAFLLPFLLWDTGPDGEGILPCTSGSCSPAPEPATAGKKIQHPLPAQAWVYAASHLTSEE